MHIDPAQSRTNPNRFPRGMVVMLATLIIGTAAAVAIFRALSSDIPRDVYTLCRKCGLDDGDIEWAMASARSAKRDRAYMLDVFERTFQIKPEAGPCTPCADAILDEAGE